MKKINTYITEKLKIRKSNKPSYKYFPKNKKRITRYIKGINQRAWK